MVCGESLARMAARVSRAAERKPFDCARGAEGLRLKPRHYWRSEESPCLVSWSSEEAVMSAPISCRGWFPREFEVVSVSRGQRLPYQPNGAWKFVRTVTLSRETEENAGASAGKSAICVPISSST